MADMRVMMESAKKNALQQNRDDLVKAGSSAVYFFLRKHLAGETFGSYCRR